MISASLLFAFFAVQRLFSASKDYVLFVYPLSSNKINNVPRLSIWLVILCKSMLVCEVRECQSNMLFKLNIFYSNHRLDWVSAGLTSI